MKNKVADRVLDKLADYTLNLKNSISARRVESPDAANSLKSTAKSVFNIQ